MNPAALHDDLFDAIHDFVTAGLNDDLTDRQVEQFDRLLRESPQAQQLYLDYVRDTVCLPRVLASVEAEENHRRTCAGAAAGEAPAAGEAGRPWPARMIGNLRLVAARSLQLLRQPTPVSLSVAGAFLALVLGILAIITVPMYRGGGPPPPYAGSPLIVAELTGVHHAEWAEGQTGAIMGAHLPLGHRMELRRGLAEVTFRSGATVVLSGPAVFTIESEMRGGLREGKLLARVPPQAAGFQIATSSIVLTDLGTEFGVVATPHGAQVDVLLGKVEATPAAAGRRDSIILEAGQAASFSADGTAVERRDADPANYHRGEFPRIRLLADARRDYRRVEPGQTTLGQNAGRGLAATAAGTGYWNYFHSAAPNPGDPHARLTPLVFGEGGDAGNAMFVGRQGYHSMPAVADAEIYRGPLDQPPRRGELIAHPSDRGGRFAVIRWTVGERTQGRVKLRGHFRLLGSEPARDGGPDGVTFAVYLNSRELLSRRISPGDNAGLNWEREADIRPGDHLDFVLGPNQTWNNDSTGLNIRIYAEPAEEEGEGATKN